MMGQEMFEQHFLEVLRACEWEGRVAVLKLRESLSGKAQECGRANDVEGIFAALQARFGMTEKEAREKLRYLRRDPHTSLAEHASYVSRLTRRAYGNLPAPGLREIELESFLRSLGNLGLRRHLTAMRLEDLEEAVKYGNEYTNMPAASNRTEVREVDVERPPQQAGKVSPPPKENPLDTRLGRVEGALERLVKAMEGMSRWGSFKRNPQPMPARGGQRASPGVCFRCGRQGHFSTKCPQAQAPRKGAGPAGN